QCQAIAGCELIEQIQQVSKRYPNDVGDVKRKNHIFPPKSGNRVINIPFVKGVTPNQAAQSQQTAAQCAIFGYGLDGILGTGRNETASWGKCGGYAFLIEADQ